MLHAAEVKLAWDANPEPDLSYLVSYGLAAGQHVVDAPLTAATGATIADLVPGTTYYFIVRAANNLSQMSPPSDELVYTVPAPNPEGWAISGVSEEQPDGYAVELAIDGNPSTFWHTLWRPGFAPAPLPHFISVDTKVVKTIGAFTYLPRQDDFTDGEVRDYELYVSLDGVDWGAPVLRGTMPPGKSLQTIPFAPRSARYFHFVILATTAAPHAAVAELGVIEATAAAPTQPRNVRMLRKP